MIAAVAALVGYAIGSLIVMVMMNRWDQRRTARRVDDDGYEWWE